MHERFGLVWVDARFARRSIRAMRVLMALIIHVRMDSWMTVPVAFAASVDHKLGRSSPSFSDVERTMELPT